MKKPSPLLLALLAGTLCAAPTRGAATFRPQATAVPGSVPGGINYQGQLQDNGAPVTAIWKFVFRIYDFGPGTGGNLIATFPPAPNQIPVNLVGGLFSVNIPVTTNTLVGGGQRWLEVEVDKTGPAGSGQTLAPREQLFSVPYALVAKTIEGTIDISTGGLIITTAPVSSNAAFYISSATAFIGIGTSHPYTLLTMSSGTLTIDGAGASLHLSSGPMVIDGLGANLNVQGSAQFGNPGTQSSFGAGGALTLASPLDLKYGGMGQDFSAVGPGGIPYFSALGVMAPLPIGAANTILQTNGIGTAPTWTSASYPGSVAQGDLLYGFAANSISPLGIGAAGTLLQSNGSVPGWTTATFPNTVAKGDLWYGYAASSVSPLGIGGASTILQSNSGVPTWTSASYPATVSQGDLLYGSALNAVSRLAKDGNATRYLSNTGAANSPAWAQVDLSNGVKNILSISSGGTGADLSVSSAQGSIPYFSNANVMTTLGPTAGGAVAGWVLATNGAGFNPSWIDLSAVGSVNTATNLAGGAQGAVPYQHAAGSTKMLLAGTNGQILMSQGPSADVAWDPVSYPLSTTANQILYSNAANTVTGLATQNNGVLVTGVTGIPSIGTDIPAAVTIGSQYIYRSNGTPVPFADGGTGADLSGVTQGGLIYKTAGPLAGTGALTGVLKGNGAAAPTALTGSVGQTAYWSAADTLGSEASVPMTQGGTGADLSSVLTGGLIYKSAASTLGGTAPLTGVLKSNGGGAPTALTAAVGQNAYWSAADTIAGENQTAMTRGGTGADLSGVPTGGLIYKDAATTLNGTAALTGVLKGNGTAAPSAGATQDDLGDGTTYKRYNPAAVTITGGSVGGTAVLASYSRTISQLRGIAPTVGDVYFCNDCNQPKIVVATGTSAGNFADALGGQFQ